MRHQVRLDELYRQRTCSRHSELRNDPFDLEQPLWRCDVCVLLVRDDPLQLAGGLAYQTHSFWSARESMTQTAAGAAGRRDAYSIILFNESPSRVVENDYTSDANGLLNYCLRFPADGGTNFAAALQAAQSVMEAPERTPVIIFLSDGECPIRDDQIYPICQRAVALGYVSRPRYCTANND
jgi:hypothetical protein